MSTPLHIPAANIVMTYNPDVMRKFQEESSFEVFKSWSDTQEEKAKEEALADKTTYQPATFIFNNGPGSNYMSLEHTLGLEEGGENNAVIKIELIDPQGLFEESLLSTSMKSLFPQDTNPYWNILNAKRAELEKADRADTIIKRKLNSGTGQWLKGVYEGLASAERDPNVSYMASFNFIPVTLENPVFDKMRDLYTEHGQRFLQAEKARREIEAIQENPAKHRLAFLNKQLARYKTSNVISKPLYITYGVGPNLLDWAPPLCMGPIVSLEYNFTGKGVRILKLILAGIEGAAPNLSQIGINPMGNLKNGMVTMGLSEPFFDDAAYNSFKKALVEGSKLAPPTEWVEKHIGKVNEPSLHNIITQAITRFIKSGTGHNNVIVLLPNCDATGDQGYLRKYFNETFDSLKEMDLSKLQDVVLKSITNEKYEGKAITSVDDIKRLEAYKQVLKGLGFSICETRENSKNIQVDSPDGGAVPWIAFEEAAGPEDVFEWFSTRKIRAKFEVDYISQEFKEKLDEFGKVLGTKLLNYNIEGKVELTTSIHVENDFQVIETMYNHGLIDDKNNPVIIWGSDNMIKQFLQARILEADYSNLAKERLGSKQNRKGAEKYMAHLTKQMQEGEVDRKKVISDTIKDVLHPIAILTGLDEDYMEDILNIRKPPAWNTPFGPSYADKEDSEMLLEDTSRNEWELLSKVNPEADTRLPVFSFGTKNPNILNIDFDVNSIYTTLIKVGPTPIVNEANLKAEAYWGKEGPTAEAAKMFSKISALDLSPSAIDKETGVPKDFMPLVERFYIDNWLSDGVTGFDSWSKVFAEADLGEEYTSIAEKRFDSGWFGTDSTNKKEFYQFMWGAFQALYTKFDKELRAEDNLSQVVIDGKEPTGAGIARTSLLAARLGGMPIVGKITTLPMFHLSNAERVITRPCLLYCVEPRFTYETTKEDALKTAVTWYTGMYRIMGFKHNISSTEVKSAFYVTKGVTVAEPQEEAKEEEVVNEAGVTEKATGEEPT